MVLLFTLRFPIMKLKIFLFNFATFLVITLALKHKNRAAVQEISRTDRSLWAGNHSSPFFELCCPYPVLYPYFQSGTIRYCNQPVCLCCFFTYFAYLWTGNRLLQVYQIGRQSREGLFHHHGFPSYYLPPVYIGDFAVQSPHCKNSGIS